MSVSGLMLHLNSSSSLFCIQVDLLFSIWVFLFQAYFKLDPPVHLHGGQRVDSKFTSGVFKTS